MAAYFSGMNSVSVTATKSGARWLLNRDKKLTEMPNRLGEGEGSGFCHLPLPAYTLPRLTPLSQHRCLVVLQPNPRASVLLSTHRNRNALERFQQKAPVLPHRANLHAFVGRMCPANVRPE